MALKQKILNSALWLSGMMSQPQQHHNPQKEINPAMPALLREAAAQGAVLLENRVLPFAKGTKLSLFGRVQQDYFFTGYGSGGDVNFPYSVNLLEGLRGCEDLQLNENLAAVYADWIQTHPQAKEAWGTWPRFHPEMPVTEALVRQAREESDQAVIVLGRASGEDRENVLKPGSRYRPSPGRGAAIKHRHPHRPELCEGLFFRRGDDSLAGRHGKRQRCR